MEAETGRPSPPRGVEFTQTERGVRVRARAGKVAPLPTVAFLISAIWTGKWALDVARLIVALRAGQGKKILYDGAASNVTNVPAVNQYLTREYRSGWDV